MVEDHVLGQTSFRNGFSQRLVDPLRSRVSGNVEVQNVATAMFDNEEALQKLELDCRHGEKVRSGDCLEMIVEKGHQAGGDGAR